MSRQVISKKDVEQMEDAYVGVIVDEKQDDQVHPTISELKERLEEFSEFSKRECGEKIQAILQEYGYQLSTTLPEFTVGNSGELRLVKPMNIVLVPV